MTVRQALTILENCDPDAELRVVDQEGWPFEYQTLGITTRNALAEHYGEEEWEEVKRDEWGENDVLLVTGQQLCYGDSACWGLARKY